MNANRIETDFVEPLAQSKLGVASCVIAVLIFVYFIAAGLIGFYGLDSFFKDSDVYAVIGIALISFFLHLAVCSVGFVVGLTLGLVSLTIKDKRRTFGIAGVILNSIPLIAAIGLAIYFFAL